jgi:hypothetical protein
MFKRDELTLAESCFNKARMHEPIFVLLGRDEAAAIAIRAWVQARLHFNKNKEGDPQIVEALACAKRMETKFHCSGCGWAGPYYKASVHDTEPPTCPVCG